jgi:hypothetical protein
MLLLLYSVLIGVEYREDLIILRRGVLVGWDNKGQRVFLLSDNGTQYACSMRHLRVIPEGVYTRKEREFLRSLDLASEVEC